MTSATQEPPTVEQVNANNLQDHLADAERGAAQQLALAKPYPGGRNVSLVPRSLEEGAKFAQLLANSEMVPKDYRGKPANVLASILMGQDVGLSPMQALQSIANINGRPSLWGDGLLAVVMSHIAYRDHEEYFEVDGNRIEGDPTNEQMPKTKAVAKFYRKGRSQPFIGTFTWQQAISAGLTGKDSPWKTYGARMLKMRARGFAARDGFPDALRGLNLAEEAIDIPAEDVRVETIPMPQRASEQPKEAPTPVATSTTPQQTEPSEPAELPAGVDVIQSAWELERRSGGKWWPAVTRGGVKFYTFDATVGASLMAAQKMEQPVRLTLGKADTNGQFVVTKIELYEG